MKITNTEVVDVIFSESERAYGEYETKRLTKLGFIPQGEDKLNNKIHSQFVRVRDITPLKYENKD